MSGDDDDEDSAEPMTDGLPELPAETKRWLREIETYMQIMCRSGRKPKRLTFSMRLEDGTKGKVDEWF